MIPRAASKHSCAVDVRWRRARCGRYGEQGCADRCSQERQSRPFLSRGRSTLPALGRTHTHTHTHTHAHTPHSLERMCIFTHFQGVARQSEVGSQEAQLVEQRIEHPGFAGRRRSFSDATGATGNDRKRTRGLSVLVIGRGPKNISK